MTDIETLKEMIDESENVVFFGGAGVSTESGIPDFRGKDGLYKKKYDVDPEYLLSVECFEDHPDWFWDFYRNKILIDGVKPNDAHYALVKLEESGKLKAIVTQNIDWQDRKRSIIFMEPSILAIVRIAEKHSH